MTTTQNTASTEATETDTSETAARPASQARHIRVDKIDRDETQPRAHFDEAALVALAASFRVACQIQPIRVRPAGGGRYVLIAGERRWRAAQLRGHLVDGQWVAVEDDETAELIGGLTKLHAVVDGDDDERGILAKQVAENVGRENMTAMEEARGFQRLIDAGYSMDEVATIVAKAITFVGWRIDLLKLIPAAQEAVDKGHLPPNMAWYLAKLESDQQQVVLTKWVRGEFSGPREAEAYVKALIAAAKTDDEQTALVQTETLTDEEREKLRVARTRVVGKLKRLAAAGEILAEIGGMEPTELARLLAGLPGGVGAYQTRVDHLQKAASKTLTVLRKAKAIAQASGIEGVVTNAGDDPALVAEEPAADQPATAETAADETA